MPDQDIGRNVADTARDVRAGIAHHDIDSAESRNGVLDQRRNVGRLADVGVYAQSVPHVGLAGRADHAVWKYALDHDFAVLTINARDFIELLDVAVHPGLIVLRESGLSRDEQWDRIKPVVEHVKDSGDQDFLVNKLIEIAGTGQFEVREIPQLTWLRLISSRVTTTATTEGIDLSVWLSPMRSSFVRILHCHGTVYS